MIRRISGAPAGEPGAEQPALLPAIADQLTDEGGIDLACYGQKLLQTTFGFAVQPDGEWNDFSPQPSLMTGLNVVWLRWSFLCQEAPS